MKPSTTVNVRLQSVMIMTAIGFTALCSWLLLSKHATGAVFVHFLKSQWLSAKRRIVLMIVCPHVFQNIFLRVFKAWPQIEWMLLVINLVFSSSFLTLFGILLALNKDLRRIFLLFLTWLFWLTASAVVLALRLLVGAYHFSRIMLDLLFFILMKMLGRSFSACQCARYRFHENPEKQLLINMHEAETFHQWLHYAQKLDELRGAMEWRKTPQSTLYEWKSLSDHVYKLRCARLKRDLDHVVFLLRLCCYRDFCGISNPLLYTEALSGTKYLIEEFLEEVCVCLRFVCTYKPSTRRYQSPNPGSDRSSSWLSESSSQSSSASATLLGGTNRQICVQEKNIDVCDATTQTRRLANPHFNFTSRQNRTLRHSLASCSLSSADFRLSSAHYGATGGTGAFTIAGFSKRHKMGSRRYPSRSCNLQPMTRPTAMPVCPPALPKTSSTCSSRFSHDYLLRFLESLRLSLGRTALCLSGGGSLAMYHMGVVKSLLALKCLPYVISGTSGGSIVAGVLAIYTDEELLNDILKPEIVARYGCRWFPPISQQVRQFFFQGHMMAAEEFEATCKAYYGAWTFKEAFQRTGRLVSIVVTPSWRACAAEALILNWVTAPDVFIWSAVAASCALPGLLPPCELFAKGVNGEPTSYCPIGLKWIDGSLSQDIPIKDLGSLFNVKQVIVSQVNPHHTPFVDDSLRDSQWMRSVENWLTLDIKHRYAKLTKFNMIPKFFGQNISAFWMIQEFEGHVTITPQASIIDWYRMITQPSLEDMADFIAKGQARTWPHAARMLLLLKVEQTLHACWASLAQSSQPSGHVSRSLTPPKEAKKFPKALAATSEPFSLYNPNNNM